MSDRVALLIDFENLVLGLQNPSDELELPIEPDLLIRLGEESGPVVVAQAYADWRKNTFNRHQQSLYSRGIELVHVLGRGLKNAVDLKLAVDAIELVYERPYIGTFVLVSGDRDFIHVLKSLRKNNKRIIGVSPERCASEDLANLCDRFVTYSDLVATYGGGVSHKPRRADERTTAVFKESLRTLFANHVGEEGMMGAQLKPLIRRHISASFDEAAFGFSSFQEMMRSLTDIVRISAAANGSDFRAFPAPKRQAPRLSTSGASGTNQRLSSISPDQVLAMARAHLESQGIDWDRQIRDSVLNFIHGEFQSRISFSISDLVNELQEYTMDDGSSLSDKRVRGYLDACYDVQMFDIPTREKTKPRSEKAMTLRSRFGVLEDFVEAFERGLVQRALPFFERHNQPARRLAAELLELTSPEEREYVEALLSSQPMSSP